MPYSVNVQKEMTKSVLSLLSIEHPTTRQYEIISTILSTHRTSELYANSILSRRQRACLYWTAKGMTAQQIAILLNLQESTIISFKREVMKKLNCKRISQAVHLGLARREPQSHHEAQNDEL